MGGVGLRCFAAAATAVLLCACGTAQASTVTVGDPFLSTGKNAEGCGQVNACTFVGIGLPAQLGLARSPVDGRIVGWRMKTFANPPPGYAIRVLRFAGGGEYTGGGRSDPVTPASTAAAQEFSADVPIEVGDYIGLDVPVGGTIARGTEISASHGYFSPTLADGATHSTGVFSYQLAFNAEIKPRPAIESLGPPAGPAGGGTAVAITGTDLSGVEGVAFGAAPATAFTPESDQRLTAVAPPVASAQVVHVTVTTDGGSSNPSWRDLFEYTAEPEPRSERLVEECVVPDLIGRKLKAARREAGRAGCAIGRVRVRSGATARTGKVAKQRPKAGKSLPLGAKIAVTLRRPPV